MKQKIRTIIIGAGLSGLSTAYHLKGECILVEKETTPGGIASSEKAGGFIFDKAGHLMHFKTKYAKDLICGLIKHSTLIKHTRSSWIFSNGIYTRYPFQINTHNLPPHIIKDCLLKMAQAQLSDKKKEPAANLKDWILDNFGEGIARHFMFPYNRKLWKIPLEKIGADWTDRFIPKATLGCAIKGAVSDFKKGFGYNRIFFYPSSGGIQQIAEAFLGQIKDNVVFNARVTGIDITRKILTLSCGRKVKFSRIISTMPLPELIRIIKGVPPAIKAGCKCLDYVSVFNLNIGVDRENISNKHWIYFPERKFIFYRVGFQSNFSKDIAPAGKSALYTEVSYTKKRPLEYGRNTIKKRILSDLRKAGILKTSDRIITEKSYDIRYAYPVRGINDFTQEIIKFLTKWDIYSIGRYGSWRYMTMEDCIMDGKLLADTFKKV